MVRKSFLSICVFLFFFLFSTFPGYGAFEEKGGGARPAGMAGAFTAVADDVNAIYFNPAGLKLIKAIEGMATTTRLYGLKDLAYYSLNGAIPTKKLGAYGFSYSQFGSSQYMESEIIFSSGQSIADGICFGLNFKIMNLKVKGASTGSSYGKAQALGLDLGAIADVGRRFRLGVMTMNLNSPKVGNTSENLAQRIMIGTSFRLFPGYTVSFDLHLPMSSMAVEPEVKAGLEVALVGNVFLRAGIENEPARFCGGLSLLWNLFSLDYAFLTHPFLSGQHLFSFSLHL